MHKKKTVIEKKSTDEGFKSTIERMEEENLVTTTKKRPNKPLLIPGQRSLELGNVHRPSEDLKVSDRTTFEAFGTINPDQVYTSEKDIKSRVTYSANAKFTVVLAFKSFLKEAWQTANSLAYKNVQKLLE